MPGVGTGGTPASRATDPTALFPQGLFYCTHQVLTRGSFVVKLFFGLPISDHANINPYGAVMVPHWHETLRRPRAMLIPSLLAVVLSVCPALSREITVLRGRNAGGPTVLFLAERSSHERFLCILAQLARLELEHGQLWLVENSAQQPLLETLADLAERHELRPDWMLWHRGIVAETGGGRPRSEPSLLLLGDHTGNTFDHVSQLWGVPVAIDQADGDEAAGFDEQLKGLVIGSPSGTRVSRQIRYTRELVVDLLRRQEMLARDARFGWEHLRQPGFRLLALYDAEGIGGGGPPNVQRVVFSGLRDVLVYRVCGEDIRDGGLGPADGAVFPGGSGRGIGDGLQAEGRARLKEFIAAGGGYVGICAGAYFAAAGLENYLHAVHMRHSQPWARGRGQVELAFTEEGKTLFGAEEPVVTTRYNNGPVYLAADEQNQQEQEFVVLAHFQTAVRDRGGNLREEMVGEAAIGKKGYGQGRILMISPHPESHSRHDAWLARGFDWMLRTREDDAR